MIDLDRTMFFKAKFDVEAVSNEDALWSVVLSLRDWAKGKAERDGYSIPIDVHTWSKLKRGDSIKSTDAEVELYSSLFDDGGIYTWACQHIETSRVRDAAPRTWVTEVGFQGRSIDSGSVSVITMYSDMPGFVGPLQEKPLKNIPGLISKLLGNKRIRCSVDGHVLQRGPREFESSDAERLSTLITDSSREVPVVLVSPTRFGETLVNPEEITRRIGPNALVFFTQKTEAIDAVNRLLEPYDYQCYGGALRVYAGRPHPEREGDHYSHRFFPAKEIREHGAEYCYDILRRALAEDVHFWETSIRVEDVKRLRRKATREREFRARSEKIQDMAISEVQDVVDDLEQKVEKLEAERDDAREEANEFKRLRFELEQKCESLELALAGTRNQDNQLNLAVQSAHVLDIASVGKIIALAFPDRLDFSERGWRSLEECSYEPKTFWQALYDMCTILHPLYAEGKYNIAASFGSQSRFKMVPGEGPVTRENSKYMREREDEYHGRRLFIEPHIASSWGNPNSAQFLRVYFNWDPESRLLVIGDTKHLTNSLTKGR